MYLRISTDKAKNNCMTWCQNAVKQCFYYHAVISINQPFMLFSQHIMSTQSVSVKLNLHISAAYSLSVSDSPLRQFPPTSPSFMRPKHIPSSHSIPPLHPSHVLKFISLYLSPLVSPLPLPPSSLSPCCSPCSVTVSSHSINQACAARAQCSTASHSPSLVPSVPVSLPHSLSHFKKV